MRCVKNDLRANKIYAVIFVLVCCSELKEQTTGQKLS